jgi:hypothetical protein
MSGTPRPHQPPSPRRLFAVAAAAAVVGFILTLSFGFADHAPAPHGVRVAVAAPAGLVQGLATGLARAVPGGFAVVAAPSARAVIDDVRSQSAAGGLVTGATGPVTIVTAGAAGSSQQQAITKALTAAATALHRQALSLDVAPLPASDRAGLSVFVFELGLLLPSVIGGIGLFLLGRRFRVWWRLAAAVVFALLTACGSVLALDAIFGALTGASAALIGVGFLGALTFVTFVAACQAVTGLPGTGLAALAFVVVGNAVSGGTVTVRVPARRLPPGRALAAQRRYRVRRARRGVPPRQRPGPSAARPRDLARRLAGRAGVRGPAAPGRTPPYTGTRGRDLRDAGRDPPAAAARPR